jgi:hypothetical protein
MKINNYDINKWSTYKELVFFFAAIIPILGILHQSVRLILISPEYLSFFSVTQIVPDTLKLIFLFLIFTVALVFFMVIFLLFGFITGKHKTESLSIDLDNYNIVEHLNLISLEDNNSINDNKFYSKTFHFKQFSNIVIQVVFFLYLYAFIVDKNLFDYLIYKGGLSFFLPILVFGILLRFKYFIDRFKLALILSLCTYYFSSIFKNDTFLYKIPNIENITSLKSKFSCDNYFNPEPKILFFNDKYVFIKTRCDGLDKIFIEDFNNVFNKNTPQ